MWADLRTAVWEGVTLAPQYTAGTAKQTSKKARASSAAAGGVRVRAHIARVGGRRRDTGGLGRGGLGRRGELGHGPRTDCPLLRCCLRLAGP